jgi:S-ribosylhomocysteine lyase
MNKVTRIASFEVDHDYITEGIYVSRIDGDVTTYDMRTRRPNMDDYMSNETMHSFEHMFATYVRNGKIGARVVYFGPMGCQTGFYLLVRDAKSDEVLSAVIDTLNKIISHKGEIFGKSQKECGNYKNLNLESAKLEAKRYLLALSERKQDFLYPKGDSQ